MYIFIYLINIYTNIYDGVKYFQLSLYIYITVFAVLIKVKLYDHLQLDPPGLY